MNVDYQKRMAIVATTGGLGGEPETFVGIARYGETDEPATAEIAVTVTDAWQRRGVATLLLEHLMRYAREHGIRRFEGFVLAENRPMLALATRLGFSVEYDALQRLMRVSIDLERDTTRVQGKTEVAVDQKP
jgi:acetyltransferase